MDVKVIRAGFLTTVQDLGRGCSQQFGVSVGGALDGQALRVANLLAGNDESAAGLEITSGTVRLTFGDDRIVAWSGGEYQLAIGTRSVPVGHPALVSANEELVVAGPHGGCRAWLAISGGVDVPVILGSRSTDLRGKFGGCEGRALRDGDILPLGHNSRRTRASLENLGQEKIARWSAPATWSSPAQKEPRLRVVRGKDWNRFNAVTLQRFTNDVFIVSPDSDRMGARLEGPELRRNEEENLISEAVVPGTIQVPPSGFPIILLGDCQTIGGYPKIAHVITVDLPIAAQLRPGDSVRFAERPLVAAHQLWLEREGELDRFRIGLALQAS